MADKRISQLIERVDIANNDVLPIVASGATTTNKVTISTIQEWMQDNLDVGVTSVGITIGSTGTDINVTGSPITTSGNITINIPTASATNRGLLSSANWTTFNNKLSSVGLTMPSAFTVSNSPLTANGTIAVTGAGTVAQYIRGDGSLADFPEAGGGGASVSYYLNGSVSQGTIGGIAYLEMNKTPILGAGTDFTINANGYIASFITDAGDPALLEIPGGNWNFETYLSASSGGGSPTFYIELYKVNSGGTATLIASNCASPEPIAFGSTIHAYFSALAVPTTVLTLTDRLALRYYVTHSGRTITLHTENSHLCQIITTFTTGLTALNGLTAQVQNFATGTSGTDFNISSASATHTFNLPDASASNRGAVTTGTQTFAGIKTFNSTITAGAEVQLVQAGTALPTFIKNISGSGLTSSGSNGIGFNNSNNLYLSGSDKGGAVFSINNTGVRTYTFQDNNGTLAFTSDLGGYLPLTGGTLTGAIVGTTSTFTNSGAGIGVGVTNSGSGDGVKITHSAGRAFNIQSSGAGFGVIINNETASTSAPFTIQKQGTTKVVFTDAGAADFSSSVTASSFVKSSGTSSQFLKADGSVDSSTYLTTGTAASTYLPLAGGTLTGALNGTSASFSGALTINSNSNSTWAAGINNLGTTDAHGLYVNIGASSTGVPFAVYKNFSSLLTIANSGAATFSSTLQAGGEITTGSVSRAFLRQTAGGDAELGCKTGGTTSIFSNGTAALTLASTGAATFSSSVTSNGSGFIIQADQKYTMNGHNSATAHITSNAGFNSIYNGVGIFSNPTNANSLPAWALVLGGLDGPTIGGVDDGFTISRKASGGSWASRFVINSTGNVGIGTASPDSQLTLNGSSNSRLNMRAGDTRYGTLYADNGVFAVSSITAIPLVFGTNDTERMRITSGGLLKASNAGSYLNSTAAYHELRQGVTDTNIAIFTSTAASPYGPKIAFTNAAPNDTTRYFIICEDSTANRFVVFSNGNVVNTNGSYGSISDIKLKENIEDATPKLDDLMKVKVRNYNLIGDDKKQIGVIAQELEEVFPAMIDESEDFEEVEVPRVDEEGNEIINEEGEVQTTKERVSKGTSTKSVKYSVFVPMLIKAMQEQQEQIKSLTEQVEALKSQING